MNRQKKYILGIDIGGTNFRIGLVSEKYEVEEFQIKPITELQKGDFIDNLVEQIFIQERNRSYRNRISVNSK